MSRVLNVPYEAFGDMTHKQPLSICVLRLTDAASLSTNYHTAKKMHAVQPTTKGTAKASPLLFDFREPRHPTVPDSSFAKWETFSLPPGLNLDGVLSRISSINNSPSSVLGGKNELLKVKVRFTDSSEMTFVRTDPTKASTLKYQSMYSANAAFDKSTGHTTVKASSVSQTGLTNARSLFAKSSVTGGVQGSAPSSTLSLPEATTRRLLFNRLDFNGNGLLSLAELDKAVVELWPFFNNKPAIMRAYKASDMNGSGWIGRSEFEYFLKYLVNYNKVWVTFAQVDSSRDRRISKDEFLRAAKKLEPNKSDDEVDAIFRKIDRNSGGYLLFDEFCEYITRKRTDMELRPDAATLQAFHEKMEANKRKKAAEKAAASGKSDVSSAYSRMPALEVPDGMTRKALFSRLDPNGNGLLSLAELDKGVIELWPRYNNKPAILRAYKAADINGTGFIGKKEFEYFLRFLVHYSNLWNSFAETDVSDDRRVSQTEFLSAAKKFGITNDVEARQAFMDMDKNKGGYVLFEEFATWMAAHRSQFEMPKISAKDQAWGEKVKTKNAKSSGVPETPTRKQFKAMGELQMPDGKKVDQVFRRVDPNGNGMLSLAELDKGVIELWPQYNNKPAMMRAYKAADRNNTGFVGRREFEFFLRFLVHYNNLWRKFDIADISNDRRVTKKEFLDGASFIGLNNMSDSQLSQLFDEMDKNKGGYVLFNEFCDKIGAIKAVEDMSQ